MNVLGRRGRRWGVPRDAVLGLVAAGLVVGLTAWGAYQAGYADAWGERVRITLSALCHGVIGGRPYSGTCHKTHVGWLLPDGMQGR